MTNRAAIIEECAKIADEYAKRAWAARPSAQEAAVAAEHIARDIRTLAEQDKGQYRT